MNRKLIISKVAEFVKESIKEYDSGHDWHHIERVRRLALAIGVRENAENTLTIELAALLHDIGDSKFRKHGDRDGGELISELLEKLGVGQDIIDEVVMINSHISFSLKEKLSEKSIVFQIVQDADRLDAMGAIGIVRAFNYGGFIGNPIYASVSDKYLLNPNENHFGSGDSTINHFYDKLLLLRGLINTETGKRLADERHRYMEGFLEQFYRELNLIV